MNTIAFFHGTSTSALPSIIQQGLIPGASCGGDCWAKENDPFVALVSARRPKAVYLTTSPETALFYAGLAAQITKSQPAVIGVLMPEDSAETEIEPDNQDPRDAWRYPRPISPDQIEVLWPKKYGLDTTP